MTAPEHVPVLLSRIVELFTPVFTDRDGVLVDATVGLGGHSDALLEAFPRLRLVALDRDPAALEKSAERLARHGGRVDFVHTVYDGLPEALDSVGVEKADGILFDLGVSSMQLDRAERGFAYSKDSPLDMRMDPTTGFTAADVLNTYAPGELIRILRDYGEERFAQRIVKAKRTFQALRIEVNGELEVLRRAMPAALGALKVGGRIVVESYQSLEDRLVKQALAELAKSRTPEGLPVELPGHGPELKLLTRGAEKAGEEEIGRNPRAASVRLRAAERIGEPR
jgi:16S rRNA (cytosine1402-N4)-methyltransferase